MEIKLPNNIFDFVRQGMKKRPDWTKTTEILEPEPEEEGTKTTLICVKDGDWFLDYRKPRFTYVEKFNDHIRPTIDRDKYLVQLRYIKRDEKVVILWARYRKGASKNWIYVEELTPMGQPLLSRICVLRA